MVSRARWRRPDPRTVALAVGVIAFAIALLFVSDVLARIGAQSVLARKIQASENTPNRPSVHLHGGFFLPQVVQGVYQDVEIDVAPVQSGPVRVADLHAHLRGVHLPLHDVLTGNAGRIVIDRTDEVALLRYTDLDHYLAGLGLPLTLSDGGHGELRVTGTVDVLGTRVSASASAKIAVGTSTLTVTPTQFDSGVAALDEATRVLLGQRFSVQIPLQALPFGQAVQRTRVGPDGITVDAHGRGIVIRG